jgi:hypothetical protein
VTDIRIAPRSHAMCTSIHRPRQWVAILNFKENYRDHGYRIPPIAAKKLAVDLNAIKAKQQDVLVEEP